MIRVPITVATRLPVFERAKVTVLRVSTHVILVLDPSTALAGAVPAVVVFAEAAALDVVAVVGVVLAEVLGVVTVELVLVVVAEFEVLRVVVTVLLVVDGVGLVVVVVVVVWQLLITIGGVVGIEPGTPLVVWADVHELEAVTDPLTGGSGTTRVVPLPAKETGGWLVIVSGDPPDAGVNVTVQEGLFFPPFRSLPGPAGVKLDQVMVADPQVAVACAVCAFTALGRTSTRTMATASKAPPMRSASDLVKAGKGMLWKVGPARVPAIGRSHGRP